MSKKVWPVEQAAQYIQEHRYSLHYDERLGCDLYTWGQKAPIALRRSVYKYRAQFLAMMEQGDSRTCVNPSLHRKYTKQCATCDICRSIAVERKTA